MKTRATQNVVGMAAGTVNIAATIKATGGSADTSYEAHTREEASSNEDARNHEKVDSQKDADGHEHPGTSTTAARVAATAHASAAKVSSAAHVASTILERTGSRLDDWWARQSPTVQRLLRWGSPALVVIIAAVTRLINLGHPASLVFDETFYVKDAWTLVNLGYESSWPAEADTQFNAGNTEVFTTSPSFVVHPPLGKWLIGLGMSWLGPENPVGWRLMTALVGILAVVVIMLLARMLLRSMVLVTLAGLLFALDGNAIVMSRVALLDNFVMLFALLGVTAVVLDRRWSAHRLDRWMLWRKKYGRSIDWGPALWWRPWLLAAGVAFGATMAVKWSGLYFLAVLAVYTLIVDALARRRAGIPFWLSGTLLKQAPASFLLTVPIALVTYLSSWIGWFVTSGGYSRTWADSAGNAWTGALAWVPRSLQSFWHFEVSVYNYHVNEVRDHPYEANPLSWLFLVRPTNMYYQGYSAGDNGCLTSCGESISGIANPIIWWAATAAVFYLTYRLVRLREWHNGLILAALAAGYLPWLLYLNRTVFQFYTIAFEPYLILGLTSVIGILLGTARDPRWQRNSGIWTVLVFVVTAVAVSAFFWPIWTGMQLESSWLALRWWLPTWR
ncbi:MAG: dolichyl-phosphate-mannose--protein mannosyltransferase [Rhodoglobus sp.]